MPIILQDGEFKVFQKIIFNETGIDLSDSKKSFIQSRLFKQLLKYEFATYAEYLRLVQINQLEQIEMINLITTNETYFFREIKHYEFLQTVIIPNHPFKETLRVWSAASSVGAEAYSVAMLLDSLMSRSDWEVFGSDINFEVIKKARVGLYPEKWIEKIPLALRSKYCLKGKNTQEGKFLIDRGLMSNIHFEEGNLLKPNNNLGKFHLIFLRNVLIYFNDSTKQKVIDNILNYLLPNGYFFISHTENLNMINTDQLEQIKTAIYRKRG